jgi:hypothetical protein
MSAKVKEIYGTNSPKMAYGWIEKYNTGNWYPKRTKDANQENQDKVKQAADAYRLAKDGF